MTSRCVRENLTTIRLLRRHVLPRGIAFRCVVGVALAAVAMRLGAALVGSSTSASALTLPTGERQAGAAQKHTALDEELTDLLASHAFTGRIAETLETRLGRRVDRRLADLGRMLWFDTITGLNDDNTCAGCHSPLRGFGDTQAIAIGIDNNGIVGPGRTGPRNQRRSPMVLNAAFYPALMWNSRFAALSSDPFDNRLGFHFPAPEGLSLSHLPHLLVAQAFIPPTERVEVAGFGFPGDNDAIRHEVLRRLNEIEAYQRLFSQSFPEVRGGQPITFEMFGRAIAEFEFTLVFADAPIDRFGRGDHAAMTASQKRGALLFFGRAGCVQCHAVAGESNEMFSDFETHILGVPQVAPLRSNVVFDGPGANEDFGLEQVTGNPGDRYKFRTSPLRNVALQPTFCHNGAFVSLDAAIRHHLDVRASLEAYSTDALDDDLRGPIGPMQPLLDGLDSRVANPTVLSDEEFEDLLAFVRDGLLDSRARPARLRHQIPQHLPSGRPVLIFQ
jgi:cytochrome c peroxidase